MDWKLEVVITVEVIGRRDGGGSGLSEAKPPSPRGQLSGNGSEAVSHFPDEELVAVMCSYLIGNTPV